MAEQQMPQLQQMPEQQPQAGKQIIIQKERISPVIGGLKIIVSVIIIVLIAALCYGVWWLIKYAMAEGWL